MDGCYKCPRRSVEPNCHNPDTCEYWKIHSERVKKKYEARKDNVETSAPRMKFHKNSGKYTPH